MVMTMMQGETMSLVPTSKLRLVAEAVRTAGDLLRAGANAPNLQTVQTDAAERVTFALAHLLEMIVFDVPGAPAAPVVVIGEIEPEGGETRRRWREEHGLSARPSPTAIDERAERTSSPDVEYEAAAVARAAGLTVVVDEGQAAIVDREGLHVLGFVPYEDSGLTTDEMEGVRRAVAADPIVDDAPAPVATVISFRDVDGQHGEATFTPAPEPGDGASPEVAPWPCLYCERDDWDSWTKVCGHMRGKHQESPLKGEYLASIEERRNSPASPPSSVS